MSKLPMAEVNYSLVGHAGKILSNFSVSGSYPSKIPHQLDTQVNDYLIIIVTVIAQNQSFLHEVLGLAFRHSASLKRLFRSASRLLNHASIFLLNQENFISETIAMA
jgi:hypothetical protein